MSNICKYLVEDIDWHTKKCSINANINEDYLEVCEVPKILKEYNFNQNNVGDEKYKYYGEFDFKEFLSEFLSVAARNLTDLNEIGKIELHASETIYNNEFRGTFTNLTYKSLVLNKQFINISDTVPLFSVKFIKSNSFLEYKYKLEAKSENKLLARWIGYKRDNNES